MTATTGCMAAAWIARSKRFLGCGWEPGYGFGGLSTGLSTERDSLIRVICLPRVSRLFISLSIFCAAYFLTAGLVLLQVTVEHAQHRRGLRLPLPVLAAGGPAAADV